MGQLGDMVGLGAEKDTAIIKFTAGGSIEQNLNLLFERTTFGIIGVSIVAIVSDNSLGKTAECHKVCLGVQVTVVDAKHGKPTTRRSP